MAMSAGKSGQNQQTLTQDLTHLIPNYFNETRSILSVLLFTKKILREKSDQH